MAFFGIMAARCTSEFNDNQRNKDIFNEAGTLNNISYTTTAYDFTGGIKAMRDSIMALTPDPSTNNPPNTTTHTGTITERTIEGVVTLPSSADFILDNETNTCNDKFRLYEKSFFLQDKDSGIFILYGRTPPVTSGASDSMEYAGNAKIDNMAILGNKMKITVTEVIRYGSGANTIPLVVDFKDAKVISRGNNIYYNTTSTAFERNADLYKNNRLEGIVSATPKYIECSSGKRSFQLQHEIAYIGKICVGGSGNMQDWVDTNNHCVNGSREYQFKLSKNLAQGTLSTFNVGTQFSYTLLKGARVRITGPVMIPNKDGTDANLMILLDQKSQVENL